MQYTDMEQYLLSALKRTDFKNLSKSDFISYTSKLGEIRPEVAKEILAQFPQLVQLMTTSIHEYMGIIDKIISSGSVYDDIPKQEMENANESRKQFYDFLKQVRSDLSKCLENPDLSPEERTQILNRLFELVRIANEKDTEIRDQEREVEDKANKKDTEKRGFNWKLVGAGAVVFIAVVGIGASVLGGKFELDLPTKS